METINQLIALAKANAWQTFALVFSTWLIGFLVRLSKSDAIGPVIPARWRPVLAYALGCVGAGLDALAGGTGLSLVLFGLLTPTVSILGHVLGIHTWRDGEELPLPKFLRRAPSPKDTLRAFVALVLMVSAVFLPSCTAAQVQQAVDTAVDVANDTEKIAKVLCLLDQAKLRGARADLLPPEVCATVEALGPYIPAARRMQANPRAFVVQP